MKSKKKPPQVEHYRGFTIVPFPGYFLIGAPRDPDYYQIPFSTAREARQTIDLMKTTGMDIEMVENTLVFFPPENVPRFVKRAIMSR